VRKAAEAFRTIGEVSAELGVKKHVLRFWELKFPQVRPMKRGGDRRYYRPGDIQLLRGIRNLLQGAGYTIKGVQKILREQGVESVKRIGASPDGGATVLAFEDGTGRSGQPRSGGRAARPRRAANRPRLSASEKRALRSVVSELEACSALLKSPPRR
jgi:DNA-binding transcriptional MerR regulator